MQIHALGRDELGGYPDFDDHEKVLSCHDDASGLEAYIAIHNTNLGPALGGCRMFPYKTRVDALTDVLRLSKGMTYKAAISGLSLGGGKGVIIADPKKDKTKEKFHMFGKFVDSLAGVYITAEDYGTSIADLRIVAEETPHVAGVKNHEAEKGIQSGDPSPITARGCLLGIKAAVRHLLYFDDLQHLTVSLQGVGNVGGYLLKTLLEEGVRVYIADNNEEKVRKAIGLYTSHGYNYRLSVQSLMPDRIYEAQSFIFSPCALGATLNDMSIPLLEQAGVKIIAGAANNQLTEDRHGQMLFDAGILYAPDYVINAGGLIYAEAVRKDWSETRIQIAIRKIPATLLRIFQQSEQENIPTNVVADKMAEEILNK